jgi:hypothetical protein
VNVPYDVNKDGFCRSLEEVRAHENYIEQIFILSFNHFLIRLLKISSINAYFHSVVFSIYNGVCFLILSWLYLSSEYIMTTPES